MPMSKRRWISARVIRVNSVLNKYKMRIVDRMIAAIEPNDAEGETPLLPILNRYKPIGTSAAVDFFTTRPCYTTQRSQVNLVVLDTEIWERVACVCLESSESVKYYVRNDHLGLSIPYEYQGITHIYEPDFIVRLVNGSKSAFGNQGLSKRSGTCEICRRKKVGVRCQ